MKALGVVHTIDDLGRLVVPIAVRRALGWEPGDPIEVFGTTQGVFLRRYEPGRDVPEDTHIDAIEM